MFNTIFAIIWVLLTLACSLAGKSELAIFTSLIIANIFIAAVARDIDRKKESKR